jgi:hypothetical protein
MLAWAASLCAGAWGRWPPDANSFLPARAVSGRVESAGVPNALEK